MVVVVFCGELMLGGSQIAGPIRANEMERVLGVHGDGDMWYPIQHTITMIYFWLDENHLAVNTETDQN